MMPRSCVSVVMILMLLAAPLAFAQPERSAPEGPRPVRGPHGPDGPCPPHCPEGPGHDFPPGKWGGPGGEFIAEVMMARMSKELNLSEEQTVLMVRRFNEMREQTRELRKQRGEVIRKLDELLQGAEQSPEKAEALVGKLRELDEAVARERQRLLDDMGKDFDPLQRAKLYLFLDRFESDMRRMVGEARERYRGGRPDGPPDRKPGDGRGPGPRPPHADGPPPHRPSGDVPGTP